MIRSSDFLTLLIVLAPASLPIDAYADGNGSRPQNVAVSPAADAIIATSMGSTYISQASGEPHMTYTLAHINVTEPSWGAVFLSDYTVVLTHPNATKLSVLTREDQLENFTYAYAVELGEEFRYSTEIIAKPGSPSRVYVANRGRPPTGASSAQSWCNAVYEVDIGTPLIVRRFLTEREPRALALSPNGQRLFVGHIQGSLGAPLVTNHDYADNSQIGAYIGDGGSILVYKTDTGSFVMPEIGERIGVGSPVRGLAVTGNTDGSYVVFFTSVGNSANSEDPASSPFFGGRDIPNVITSVRYNSSHALQQGGIQHAVFDHRPDWTPTSTTFAPLDGLPAVLPEKIVVRDYLSGIPPVRKRELLITNSGSGTVSRTRLLANGSFEIEPNDSMAVMTVLLSRDPVDVHEITIKPPQQVWFKRLKKILNGAGTTNQSHVDVSRSGQPRFTSNVRGIAYASGVDKVWVATQFDNELLRITPSDYTTAVTQRLTIAGASASVDERNFFGFGRGFFFREHSSLGHPNDVDDTVGNQTCSTCHVDGHTDGKVRLTRQGAANPKPVAVPSCFDVGNTEWLFFDGLRTVLDGDFTADSDCNYCLTQSFFDDTELFTTDLMSPRSPHNWGGVLTANEMKGRYLFEAMNCSRCHAGPVAPFLRTIEEEDVESFNGPFPGSLSISNRFLHDATQVFISGVDDSQGNPPPSASLRNASDVGTRVDGGTLTTVNTPALAGLWDNRPYLHDGRYRTLDEVLTHTWIDSSFGFRAAPLDVLTEIPDNFFGGSFPSEESEPDRLGSIHQFKAHAPNVPGRFAVKDFLTGNDYQDLQAFLLALSSQTDPCGGTANFILNLALSDSLATWNTAVAAQCNVVWTGPQYQTLTQTTPRGISHSRSVPLWGEGDYTALVTAQVRTVCGNLYTASASHEIGGSGAPAVLNERPLVTALVGSRPNPFNPETTIEFSLAQNADVSLIVYDIAGRRVRTLVDEHRKADRYLVQWNGRDDNGVSIASGVYFCRMVSGSYQSTQKLVLLK